MINVVIADNQALIREGVIAILSGVADINVAGNASTTAELSQLIKSHQPDVIVIDDDFSAGISDQYKNSNFLILSNNQSREVIIRLINNGIKNHIFKKCSREEIIKAVYATAKRETFFCEQTLSLIRGGQDVTIVNSVASLTYREIEIAQLIATGMTTKDIAGKLFLSVDTIKTHRKNIIKKLGFTFKHASELIVALSYLSDMFI